MDNEHQRIVVLDFLHCGLCCQRVLDDSIVIQLTPSWGRFSWIFRSSSLLKSPWPIESDIGTDFLFDGGMPTL